MDLGRIFLLIRIFLCRVWRNLFGPVVEIDIEDVVDRLGNRVSDHELLEIFQQSSLAESVAFYQEYNERMKSLQEKEWLRRFLGYPKDIPYWVTPWAHSKKLYKEKHLSLEYAEKYVSKLWSVRKLLEGKGYKPEVYGYITGQLLIDADGKRKFIIWNGHRRALSLAALGYRRIRVEVSGGDRWTGKIENHVVQIAELSRWKNIKNRNFTPEEARAFFNYFFS